MEIKLIKTEDEQVIMYSLSGDNLPENYVLSKENCDSLFGVVDVDKLAEEFLKKHKFASSHIADITSFKYGFNKAMELNKDKLFTLEDMIRMSEFVKIITQTEPHITIKKLVSSYVQSLQQPTEIEVEIDMSNIYAVPEPKLDSSGNLILKKI